jgi:thiol-disulfide isomerase/thioredoxin
VVPGVAGGKLELIEAPPIPVAKFIADEVARASRDGARVLVYEGATWCEPCQRFHRAAQAGELDAEFPRVRLLEFDADRDGEELDRAGYKSEYIPLFAAPRVDGTSSGHMIQGGTKGDRAVREIAPRLHMLLDTTASGR